jgi:hypothetical protein
VEVSARRGLRCSPDGRTVDVHVPISIGHSRLIDALISSTNSD